MDTKYYELFNNPLYVRAVGVTVKPEVLASDEVPYQEAVEYIPATDEYPEVLAQPEVPYRPAVEYCASYEVPFDKIIPTVEVEIGGAILNYSNYMYYYWKVTPMQDRINKVQGGKSTTWREGTRGWNEYQVWLSKGHLPLPAVTLEELRLNCIQKCKQDHSNDVKDGRCSTGLGFDADQRMGSGKYDILVIQGAVKQGDTSYFVDADDEYHEADNNMFSIILSAMEKDFGDKLKTYHETKNWISVASQEELEGYYES